MAIHTKDSQGKNEGNSGGERHFRSQTRTKEKSSQEQPEQSTKKRRRSRRVASAKLDDSSQPVTQNLGPELPESEQTETNESSISSINTHELDGKLIHIKVGDSSFVEKNHELSNEIQKVENSIVDLIEQNSLNCYVFVTHYAVDINVIEPAYK